MFSKIKIGFLGGAGEVGRAAVLVETEKENLLFDYGINVQDMSVPMQPKQIIDALFLSHAHLDHSGYIPSLYKKNHLKNLYLTRMSLDLCSLLLRDSLKVQKRKKLPPQFLLQHIKQMERAAKIVDYEKKIKTGQSSITFFNAGHVPGSASILIESQKKRILYTGDIKFIDTELMRGAYTDFKDIDVLISEATYSYKNHPERRTLSDKLREIAQNTVYNNGILLLPSFSIGRTQEMLSMLSDLGFPIILDGMGIEATRLILSNPKSVKDPNKLKKAFSRAYKIRKNSERKEITKKPCIIITTAGMLNGGPISYYIKKLHNREDCALILSGYQVEGTVGRRLLDTGRYVNEGLDIKPKMSVRFMDFSAHCDRNNLINFFKKINPEKILICHTDHGPEFAGELKEMGFDTHAPENGERIKI